jgi:hypothetical protein
MNSSLVTLTCRKIALSDLATGLLPVSRFPWSDPSTRPQLSTTGQTTHRALHEKARFEKRRRRPQRIWIGAIFPTRSSQPARDRSERGSKLDFASFTQLDFTLQSSYQQSVLSVRVTMRSITQAPQCRRLTALPA